MGQLIQRGRQLPADEPGGKRLRRDEHQILTLEQAGVLVLLGGRQAAEILGHASQRAVGRAVRQGLEVDVQRVIAVLHRRCRRRRVIGRVIRLALLRGQLQLGLGRAEQGVFRLQPHRRVQAELGHRRVGLEVVGIAVAVCTPAGQPFADEQEDDADRRDEQQRPFAHAVLRDDALTQQDAQRQWQQRRDDERQALGHDAGYGAAEARDHVPRHGADEAHGKIGLEIAAAAVLYAQQQRPQRRDDQHQHLGQPTVVQQVHQQTQQQSRGDGEQHDHHQRAAEEGVLRVEGAEQQLVVQQRQGEEYPVQRPSRHGGCVQPGGRGSLGRSFHTLRRIAYSMATM